MKVNNEIQLDSLAKFESPGLTLDFSRHNDELASLFTDESFKLLKFDLSLKNKDGTALTLHSESYANQENIDQDSNRVAVKITNPCMEELEYLVFYNSVEVETTTLYFPSTSTEQKIVWKEDKVSNAPIKSEICGQTSISTQAPDFYIATTATENGQKKTTLKLKKTKTPILGLQHVNLVGEYTAYKQFYEASREKWPMH